MNLKRAISAVCAAAVLVSTSLSDLPAQLSAYSHAYAALTEFRYEFSQSPVAMAVQSADDGSLKCEVVTRFPADGVTNGVTTVAELRRLYSGLTVNGFEFSNSSLEGLTAEDIHTSISVLSGTDSNSYDGWYAVTDKDTLDFADMPADNDSKVVQSLSFHIYIDGGAVSRLGMKLGDRIYLNSDGSGFSYYTHTEPGGPITMTVTEATWENNSGMSCAYNSDFEIPGVTKGVTTFGELKALYDGIKVEGYEFRGSTVEGMTETDLVPTIGLITGSDWNWKAVYNTTEMNFSSDLADVADDDIVQSIAFQLSVQDDSFAKLGLKIGDSFVVNPDGRELDYYEYTMRGGPLRAEVEEIQNEEGTSLVCTFTTYLSLPGVTIGETTAGQLKNLYRGVRVGGFELRESTVEGLTADDLVPTVAIITGDNWVWNASYCSNEMTFSDVLKNVHDSDVVKELSFRMTISGDSVERLGLKAGDVVVINQNDIRIFLVDDTIMWDEADGADHYEVFCGGSLLDNCIANNSVGFKMAMSLNGYKPGRYQLDVYAVYADETRKLLGSVDYDYGVTVSDKNMFAYSENDDGTVTITGGNIVTPKLEIPAELEGKKVSAIGMNAFTGNNVITDLVIPEGVTTLYWYSFNTCRNLETVTLPDSLEFIDGWAFERCSRLKTISIPANVTRINGDKDYSNGYDGLVEVVIPIPKGHRGKTFYCYRLLDDGTKELIPGKQREDSYVVYLEHFSVYAFVADEEHTCVFSESWANDKSGHWHECACGKTTEPESHIAGDWITDVEAAAAEDGHRYKACTVCGYVMEEETIKAEKTAAPVISPNGGTFTGSQTVTITCAAPDAVIYYTTDGSTPTADSAKYSGSFTLTASATVKAFAVSADAAASDIVTAVFTKKSGTSGGSSGGSSSGSSGGSSRPSSAKTEETKPAFNGKETSWADIAGSIAKLAEGGTVTISLNGNYTVPAEVMKQIADKKIKATFVVDSVKSWVIDGAQIKNAASTDLTLIPTRKLKTGGLAGTEGVQFTVSSADIPAGIAVSFKADFAGRFANLYKSVDGKLVFMGCAKLDSTGKSTVPGIDGKGGYAVMLSELSALPGDMNNDGILNALDASEILKYAVGISAGANLAAADLNGDGTVNASDAAAVLRMAVG